MPRKLVGKLKFYTQINTEDGIALVVLTIFEVLNLIQQSFHGSGMNQQWNLHKSNIKLQQNLCLLFFQLFKIFRNQKQKTSSSKCFYRNFAVFLSNVHPEWIKITSISTNFNGDFLFSRLQPPTNFQISSYFPSNFSNSYLNCAVNVSIFINNSFKFRFHCCGFHFLSTQLTLAPSQTKLFNKTGGRSFLGRKERVF